MEKVRLDLFERKNLLINGIYQIVNITNNKFYIGSCSSKTYLYERLCHHRENLIKNRHINKHLQNSFNKYGIEQFYIIIIEECLPENCIEREQYWIDTLNPHYNLCKQAGSSFGQSPSQETRNKISNSNKKWFLTEDGIKLREKLSHMAKMRSPRKHTDESKLKISQKNKGKRVSEESKQKMRVKRPSLYKKIINVDTKTIYSCSEQYSKLFNINQFYVQALCRGERKSNKHNIQYYEEDLRL